MELARDLGCTGSAQVSVREPMLEIIEFSRPPLSVFTVQREIMSLQNLERACFLLASHIRHRMGKGEKIIVGVDLSSLKDIDPTNERTLKAIGKIGDTVTELNCTSSISAAFIHLTNPLSAGVLTMAVNTLFTPPIPVYISASVSDLRKTIKVNGLSLS